MTCNIHRIILILLHCTWHYRYWYGITCFSNITRDVKGIRYESRALGHCTWYYRHWYWITCFWDFTCDIIGIGIELSSLRTFHVILWVLYWITCFWDVTRDIIGIGIELSSLRTFHVILWVLVLNHVLLVHCTWYYRYWYWITGILNMTRGLDSYFLK